MTYIDLMLAWDMMAGLGGLKLKANQSFVQSQAIWLKWCEDAASGGPPSDASAAYKLFVDEDEDAASADTMTSGGRRRLPTSHRLACWRRALDGKVRI